MEVSCLPFLPSCYGQRSMALRDAPGMEGQAPEAHGRAAGDTALGPGGSHSANLCQLYPHLAISPE